jgi:hypothetical protein
MCCVTYLADVICTNWPTPVARHPTCLLTVLTFARVVLGTTNRQEYDIFWYFFTGGYVQCLRSELKHVSNWVYLIQRNVTSRDINLN